MDQHTSCALEAQRHRRLHVKYHWYHCVYQSLLHPFLDVAPCQLDAPLCRYRIWTRHLGATQQLYHIFSGGLGDFIISRHVCDILCQCTASCNMPTTMPKSISILSSKDTTMSRSLREPLQREISSRENPHTRDLRSVMLYSTARESISLTQRGPAAVNLNDYRLESCNIQDITCTISQSRNCPGNLHVAIGSCKVCTSQRGAFSTCGGAWGIGADPL